MRRTTAAAITTALLGAGLVPLAPAANALPTTTFSYTGAPQTWTIPAGVQSVYVTLAGGGGGALSQGIASESYTLEGVLTIPEGATALEVNIGGNGQPSVFQEEDSPSGGWGNGYSGGDGGSADGTGESFVGASGGGASDIRLPGAAATDALMVAAGSGGIGGAASTDGSYDGGTGGNGGLAPTAGGAGGGSNGDGGAGGAPGSAAGTAATAGGSGNGNSGGGGGGGGGWAGGSGGQAGQADDFSLYNGGGGGGGGGLSYANPDYVTSVQEGEPDSQTASIEYVPLLGNDASFTAGQYAWLYAASSTAEGVSFEVVGGELPPGLTMNGTDAVIKGTPTEVGTFTFLVAGEYSLGPSASISSVVSVTWTIAPGDGAYMGANTATAITGTSATLNGFVNGGGEAITDIACRYTTDSSFNTGVMTAPATPSSVPANLDRTWLSCPISGLASDTLYSFEFVGDQAGSELYSNISGFRTSSTPAVVTTGAATDVTTTSATGNGTVSATQDVTAIDCRVATRLEDVASATPVAATPSSTTGVVSGVPVSCAFTGLAANTLYYYGVFATDADGTATSATWSDFVTGETPPRLGLIEVGAVTTGSAGVAGSISATNQRVTAIYCRAVRGRGNPDFGSVVAATPFTASRTARDFPVACDLTGLSPDTEYRVRMYATDSDGTSSSGNTVIFTTASSPTPPPPNPPTPTPTPTPVPTPAPTPTPTPSPTPAPAPTLVLPGLVQVPPGTYIPVRTLPVRTELGRTLADAPTVTARRDVAFALRVEGLPPGRTMQVAVARGDQGTLRWEPLGTADVDDAGRATLPALLSTRTTTLTIRLAWERTTGRTARYVEVQVRP